MSSVSTGSDELHVQVDDGVAVITMNRPQQANALSRGLFSGLMVSLDELANGEDVGCLVLRGAGAHFSAGGDLRAVRVGNDGANGAVASADLRRRHNRVLLALYDFPALTIAAVTGSAVGAGMALALACDFRIADSTARFTTGFIGAASAGDFGGSFLLTQQIGAARAKAAFALNETFDAERANNLGLLHRLVEPAALEAEWRQLAAQIVAGPRLAQRAVKENINRAVQADLRTCLDFEALTTVALMQTDDHAEAKQAFAERRQPHFRGI